MVKNLTKIVQIRTDEKTRSMLELLATYWKVTISEAVRICIEDHLKECK